MPKSYSADLRRRVIEAVASGATRHEAAGLFGIAVSTAVKWWQRWRDTGSTAPNCGGSTSRLEEHTTLILGLVKEVTVRLPPSRVRYNGDGPTSSRHWQTAWPQARHRSSPPAAASSGQAGSPISHGSVNGEFAAAGAR